MAGQCWVCKRQARGLGHSDNRFRSASPAGIRWTGSLQPQCRDAFHALYGQWLRTDPGRRTCSWLIRPNSSARRCAPA